MKRIATILLIIVLSSCVTVRVGMDDPDTLINIGFFDIDWWIKVMINSPKEREYENLELKPSTLKVDWNKIILTKYRMK